MRLVLLVLCCAACDGTPRPSTPATSTAAVRFRLPLSEPWRIARQVTGFDHDPEDFADDGACLDYAGRSWPWCYDQHQGSDFSLIGGFLAMDTGSTPVVAAADGVVVQAEDGHYDRCQQVGLIGQIDCAGHAMKANQVVLEHVDGTRSVYAHLMQGSVAVEEGDEVRCGDLLGLVGSSGYSAGPHLHFGVIPAGGEPVDAYVYGGDGWWVDQGTVDGLPGLDCP